MKVKGWGFEEEEAVKRIPYGRKCPERGGLAPHRLGLFPIKSLLDGGSPGVVVEGICIHCGKRFPKVQAFDPRPQPRKTGSHKTSGFRGEAQH